MRSSDVDFFCGQSKCSSKESCCIYRKKNGQIKLAISFKEDDSSNNRLSQSDDDEEIICISSQNAAEEREAETESSNDESESGVTCDEFEDKLLENTGVTLETLNELSQCTFPTSGIFTKSISNLKCQMDRNTWEDLINNHMVTKRNKKYFAKGSWQHIICDYIRQANPYCTVLFKRHLVYQATKRPSRTDRVFNAVGYCKHQSCKVKNINVTIKTDMTMEVTFDSLMVAHDVGETCARPIRGIEREQEKNKLDGGKFSASVEYARRINKTPNETFISGNRDNIGKTVNVLKQIAHEKRTDQRMDTLELDSLLKLKKKYEEADDTESKVKGFIQVVSVDPVIIMLWTRGSVKVFHDLSKMDAVFWDATGHVVKSRLTNKKLFYYELTIRNPTTGRK